MIFKGIQKTSFIDYPDRPSTVIFTGGCNFRCSYCHNSELIYNHGEDITENKVINFLEKRAKYIDAITISGGEPTLHKDLPSFIKKVKNKNFIIKLDTNGTNPEMLKYLLENKLIDYIAMDIKAPLKKYECVTKCTVNIENIKKSIKIIINSNINYEFRTTAYKKLLNINDFNAISNDIKGANKYIIQNFRDSDYVLDGKGIFNSFKKDELNNIKNSIKDNLQNVSVR